MRKSAALTFIAVIGLTSAAAQTPATKPVPPRSPSRSSADRASPGPSEVTPAARPEATETSAVTEKASAEGYTYQPEGRRDPFVSLLGTGTEAAASRKGEGSAGVALSDISVRGIMESRGALIAIVQGPDNRTYLVRQGDRFLDGTVKTVTPQGLVVIQEVNDPLSLVKQREIRKLLRSLEDAKK